MAPFPLERRGPVGVIRLGARRRVPVLDRPALESLETVLQEAREAALRCIVLTGGENVFAAGADLRELEGLDAASARELSLRGQRVLDRLEAVPAVTLAAIGGRCIGGAFDLAMACDLRIASDDAVFEHPGPRMGFITGWGGTSRLPRLLGPTAGPLLRGLSRLEADAALRAGLVSQIIPRPRLESGCLSVADRIASAGAERVRAVKETLRIVTSFRGDARAERRWTALLRRAGTCA